MTAPILANLICGSPQRNHDFDFARWRLSEALYSAGDIRTDAFNDYETVGGDMLVTYTSQVPVSDDACEKLQSFLESGGRWFAIHASNSVRDNQHLPGILGSKFITHPAYQKFPVTISKPSDPLLKDIEPFEVDDEIYCITHQDDIDVLLETTWGGEAFGGHTIEYGRRPLMYRRAVGKGGVLYLALGHANRRFDGPPGRGEQPDRRGPWAMPVYQTLIRRGIDWAAQRID